MSSVLTVLTRAEWTARARAHQERVDAVTAGHRERARTGARHAIEDFLYDYYSTRPSVLRRWSPGVGVVLEDAEEFAERKWFARVDGGWAVDAAAFYADRGGTVDFVAALIAATASRPLALGCFGMHEWAMVYHADATRHPLPLRLGAHGTDRVVEANSLVCTHFDAFRFFMPDAVGMNAHQLTRADQMAMEQPGCLHATMDLYKWCAKLAPAMPAELQQDCFELALEVRHVDMQASPYDVSSFGLEAIRVETPEGKAEYAALQRDFAARASALRERILEQCAAIATLAGRVPAPAS